MSPSTLSLALSSAALLLSVSANPTPLSTLTARYVPDLNAAFAGPTCLASTPSLEPDFSFYTFTIDSAFTAAAAAAGLTKLGIRQYCESDYGDEGQGFGLGEDTTNWAYVDMDLAASPVSNYTVKVDRCEKGAGRYAWSYNLYLCDVNNLCRGDERCGLDRQVCNVEEAKGVNVTDTNAWMCDTANL